MPHRILIVEDHPDNRKLVHWVLEDEGYDFEDAVDGESALELVQTQHYDLVLLDIGLPGINGKEVARRLRADARFKELPIIAVTAHAVVGETEEIMASGVDGIVTKPIDEVVLLRVIRQKLARLS